MASYAEIKCELSSFLSKEPYGEVLALRGAWGVGKTHLFHTACKELPEDQNDIKYVSLFGVNSVEEVIRKLCFGSGTGSKIATSLLGEITNFFGAGEAIVAELGFQSIRNQKICFDDIERRGEGLSIKSIMGLISLLKEERNCRIVFIVNDAELGEADSEFKQYNEKVVDVSPCLSPLASEATEILMPSPKGYVEATVKERCNKLRIQNLRTIKKALRLSEKIEDSLNSVPEDIKSSAYSTLVLLTWILDNPSAEEVPSIGFLRDRQGVSVEKILRSLEQKSNPPSEEEERKAEIREAWGLIIEEYGFTHLDFMDEQILFLVENGYIVPETFKQAVSEAVENYQSHRKTEAQSKAWSMFHSSFDDNADEVLSALYNATLENVSNTSAHNTSIVIDMLDDYKRTEEADTLIAAYLEVAQKDDASMLRIYHGDYFHIPNSGRHGKKLIEAAKQFAQEKRENTSLKDLVENMGEGWTEEEKTYLAGISKEEFVALFKQIKDEDQLKFMGYKLLFYKKVSNRSEVEDNITTKVVEALKCIGNESPLNRHRLHKFGIYLSEDDDENP